MARVSRKVVDALPRTPGIPRTPGFSLTPGGQRAQIHAQRKTANAIQIADEPSKQTNHKCGFIIDAKEVDIEKGQTNPVLFGKGSASTKKGRKEWMQRLWANDWK